MDLLRRQAATPSRHSCDVADERVALFDTRGNTLLPDSKARRPRSDFVNASCVSGREEIDEVSHGVFGEITSRLSGRPRTAKLAVGCPLQPLVGRHSCNSSSTSGMGSRHSAKHLCRPCGLAAPVPSLGAYERTLQAAVQTPVARGQPLHALRLRLEAAFVTRAARPLRIWRTDSSNGSW